MHADEKLSHRVLITAASTDKTSVRSILFKSRAATRDIFLKTIAGGPSTAAGDLVPIELVFHSRPSSVSPLTFPSLEHWCVHLFMDLVRQPTENSVQPPSTEPCHICIFLIAHNSPSPDLTQSIKTLRPTSNSPLRDSSDERSLTLCCPGTKSVSM